MANATIETVIANAKAQLGKPYLIGAEGPDKFDCSGLMFYIFKQAGQLSLIGGGRHRARWYAAWCKAQGIFVAPTEKPQRGDLVFYGHQYVTHVGIYLGGRRRRVISALINPYGVSKHRVDGITVPVYGFGRIAYPA